MTTSIKALYTQAIDMMGFHRVLFFSLFALLFGLGILYGVVLGSTVSNISQVSQMKSDLIEINSELSELEFEYMKYKNLFTLEYSKSLGMSEVKTISYVSRNASSATLTLVE